MIKNETIKIKGMSCSHCVKAVRSELEKLNLVSLQVEIGSASILYDDTMVKKNDIVKAIHEAGYEISESELAKN